VKEDSREKEKKRRGDIYINKRKGKEKIRKVRKKEECSRSF
jgi:hypothetical protein